jgi:menaquinone-dependent protoporphyrinogen oxidase
MSAKKISRRDFLKIGCLSTAALGLTICGMTALAPDPPPIDLSSFTFGEKRMDNRILIAYATFAGSTKEVAVEIGKTLGARGFSVDVIPVLENPKVSDYQFVLIGSAVYQSSWRSEAIEFIKTNQIALNRVSVAFFSVCLSGLADDEAKRSIIYGTVRPMVNPVAEVLFAGRVNRRGMSLIPGGIARFTPTMDFRDWDKIHSWAQSVFAAEEANGE